MFTSDEAQRLTHYFLRSTNSGSSCWIEQLEGKERINCVLFGSKIDLDEAQRSFFCVFDINFDGDDDDDDDGVGAIAFQTGLELWHCVSGTMLNLSTCESNKLGTNPASIIEPNLCNSYNNI